MQFATLALTWFMAHMRVRSERGQDLIEYAILGGLIAAALVGIGVLLQTPIRDMAINIGKCVDFSSTSTCGPFS